MNPNSAHPVANTVRLDKWLWAVRLFKTRSQAADACRLLRVRLANQEVKASRAVKLGDVFDIHEEDLVRTVQVRGLIEKRVAGKLVPEFLEDLTAPELYEAARERRVTQGMSPVIAPVFKPSKKDRELLRKLYQPLPEEEDA